MSRNMIFHHQRGLACQSLHLWPNCPKSSAQSSTMKVLFMLLTCPLTRSEGFSIEVFGVQNNSRNVVLTASNVSEVILIPLRERELVSLSLWASLKSLATRNINVIKLSLNGKRLSWLFTCAVFHFSRFLVCSDPKPSHLLLVFQHFLSHIGKILTLSLFFVHGRHRQVVHPSVSKALQRQ